MNWHAWQDEQEYEHGARLGDPRRCPIHGTAISSPDGMFDGLCGRCEALADGAAPDAVDLRALARYRAQFPDDDFDDLWCGLGGLYPAGY
jgi:hypothetical protein